jgi:CRISPR-associated protein Csm2
MNYSKITFEPLSPDLFSDVAQTAARDLVAGLEERSSKNKSTQLRRFYNELVMWHDKVYAERGEQREAKYQELAPYIKMLNAKVAYAKARDHVDANFEGMFAHCIKQINDATSLKHCKLFMEAFIGFYKAQGK